jgi:hypothetical protein
MSAGAQSNSSFSSPIKHSTRLSGSYGEPRTGHFHSGIDFKQSRGVPHDSIFSVGDGMIARISVKPDGYGNSLYIEHPNGYTSVYAHLYDFSPAIRQFINQKMYAKKVHRLDFDATSDTILIRQGEFIGIMGNTGRSSAPHLHFEIRDTKVEVPINPANFGFKPSDDQAPTIKGIIIYSLGPDGEIYSKQYISATKEKNGKYSLDQKMITVESLAVGIGVHCYDTMNGASNHNGIYGMTTYVNGLENFAFVLDKIPFNQSGYIHSHMDYEEKIKNLYVSKGFKAPHNKLNIYNDSLGNGVIIASEIIPTKVDIEVSDFEKNISRLTFQIQRKETISPISLPNTDGLDRVASLDSFIFVQNNMQVVIPPNSLDRPYYLKPFSLENNVISFKTLEEIPLFNYMKLSALFSSKNACKKCVYTSKNKKGETVHFGGKWENDSTFITFVDELNTYEILVDSVSPTIQNITLPNKDNSRLSFVIKDNITPSYSKDFLDFEVLIDNQWTLCEYDIKTGLVTHNFIPSSSQSEHSLMLKVKDSVGNESILKTSFIR